MGKYLATPGTVGSQSTSCESHCVYSANRSLPEEAKPSPCAHFQSHRARGTWSYKSPLPWLRSPLQTTETYSHCSLAPWADRPAHWLRVAHRANSKKRSRNPRFHWFRSILSARDPSWHVPPAGLDSCGLEERPSPLQSCKSHPVYPAQNIP